MTDLNLREVDPEDEVKPEKLQNDRVVEVYSERFEESLRLKLTHTEPTYGGTIVSSPKSPLLGEADHVHFELENVVSVVDK